MVDIQKIWPDWTVDCIIGKGSFGTVYKIKKTAASTTIYSALKVIHLPQNEGELEEYYGHGIDEQSVRRILKENASLLENEIKLMISLKSSLNVVSIEDYKVVPNGPGWSFFIRMELLESLLTYTVKNQGLSLGETLRLGIDISNALISCERAKVIHRDIKPANIFRTEEGYFKLGDFGIAKQLESRTFASTRVGTPAVEAPEILAGRKYNNTVDIYALGIVLYTYVNYGRRPFFPPYPEPIRMEDLDEAQRRRMEGEPLPDPVNSYPGLTAIIKKACAFRPEDRYQSARELKDALERFKYQYEHEGDGGTVLFDSTGTGGADGGTVLLDSVRESGSKVASGLKEKTGSQEENRLKEEAGSEATAEGSLSRAPGTPAGNSEIGTERNKKPGQFPKIVLVLCAVAVIGILGAFYLMKDKRSSGPDDTEGLSAADNKVTQELSSTEAGETGEALPEADKTGEGQQKAGETGEALPEADKTSESQQEAGETAETPTAVPTPTLVLDAPVKTEASGRRLTDQMAIEWEDSAQEDMVRRITGISEGDITTGDVKKITEISLPSENLQDIRFLAYFENLETLDLSYNSISDLSALASLNKLQVLYLYNNEISDLSPLKSLTALTDLDLSCNHIEDISALGELKHLHNLSIRSNAVQDIGPLQNLEKLKILRLDGNKISDVEALSKLKNLTILYLADNPLTDYSAVAELALEEKDF